MTRKNECAVPVARELETFVPVDCANRVKKYEIQPSKKDLEKGLTEFNPFLERKNDHPTTDGETLTHLLTASLGTGILSIPIAFKFSGLVLGIFLTILTAIICTHCSYILVKCTHTIYKRTGRTTMNFAEVAEAAFATGPKWGHKYARFFKAFLLQSLFWTNFGTCSVYTVIVARNFQQVAEHHLGYTLEIRWCIASLVIPLILLSWTPNLKYLASFSMIANLLTGFGLGITFYYLAIDLPPVTDRPMVGSLWDLPGFFSITIFSVAVTGVVMPLENQMKTPQNLVGICGVLNKGISGVTFVYILLGFLGFLRYGDATDESITLNLPTEKIPAQLVKIAVALAVFFTFGLQFYVCLETGWDSIKNTFVNRPLLANYVMRTVLVTAAVLLAVAMPTISPFIGLIGAFCFSILGLLIPIAIEFVTYWDSGFGPFNWVIYKNIIISIFGVMALVFGSKDAIEAIITLYAPAEPILSTVNNSTL